MVVVAQPLLLDEAVLVAMRRQALPAFCLPP